MNISKRIRDLREEKGIKQVDVANKLGLERGNYSRIERKGDKLTIKQVKQIADALGVNTKELLFSEKSTELEKAWDIAQTELKLLKIQNKTILTNMQMMLTFLERIESLEEQTQKQINQVVELLSETLSSFQK